MKCWQCGSEQPEPLFGKLAFRAECAACGAALHCCRNCKYFHPGKPNDCEVPGTEFVAKREQPNLCEEFRPKAAPDASAKPSASEIEDRLFGSSSKKDGQSPKDKFDSLFKSGD